MNDDHSMIETVLGPRRIEDLGRTLFHEHIYISFPGADLDPNYRFDRGSFIAEAEKRVRAVQNYGVTTFIDPSPIELGRDVSLYADISERTGLNIICATGFYTERAGLPFYWRVRRRDEIAELLLHEIENGIGERRIKPGVIKCSTGAPKVTDAERKVLEAASVAHKSSGLPIITHTDLGQCGDDQQRIFLEQGVEPHRVVIGHSCGNPDPAYHARIVEGGSYIGFDRIGLLNHQKDEIRADNLAKLINAGYEDHILLSHDFCFGWHGKPHYETSSEQQLEIESARAKGEWPLHHTHLFERFIPMMEQRGIGSEVILRILDRNPIRFLKGDVPTRRASRA